MSAEAPPLPNHKYLPGRNARHPEGAFDFIRDRARGRTETVTAAVNPAWLYGLRLLEAGFFWEAHEVLEPVWMNAAPNAPERHMVQAVIQLANAALKRELGREKAAERLCVIVEGHLAEAVRGAGSEPMGLHVETLHEGVRSVLATPPGDVARIRLISR